MEKVEEIRYQKQIIQMYGNTKWFSTTTDSVLLCDFASLHLRDKKILDLGSGIGTIPLLLSLKTKAEITGIEIQEDVNALAEKSVLANHKEAQIHLFNKDMKQASTFLPTESFDVVLSNPPYFPYQEEKVTNLDSHQKYARHEVAITLEELIQVAKQMLKDHGRFIFIYRTERLLDVFETLHRMKMEIKKIQFVYHSRTSASKLFLIEATIYGKRELKILPPLYIDEREAD